MPFLGWDRAGAHAKLGSSQKYLNRPRSQGFSLLNWVDPFQKGKALGTRLSSYFELNCVEIAAVVTGYNVLEDGTSIELPAVEAQLIIFPLRKLKTIRALEMRSQAKDF